MSDETTPDPVIAVPGLSGRLVPIDDADADIQTLRSLQSGNLSRIMTLKTVLVECSQIDGEQAYHVVKVAARELIKAMRQPTPIEVFIDSRGPLAFTAGGGE
jgi:hypothetical protein